LRLQSRPSRAPGPLHLPAFQQKSSEGEVGRLGDAICQNLAGLAYLAQLWVACNQCVAELTQRKLPELVVLANNNARAMDQLERRKAALEALKNYAAESCPLKSDDAAAIEAAIDHEVQTWETLVSCHLPDWLGEQQAAEPASGAVHALEEAVRTLVDADEVKAGAAVELGLIAFEVLLLAPLVDRRWIDRHVVELAEFGASFEEGGLFWVTENHCLAALQICYRAEGRQLAAADQKLIAAIREETRAALATFKGRMREIGGRIYLHIDDCRAWPARKVQGDLPAVEGIMVQSWNAWVDQHGGEGKAELAEPRCKSSRPWRMLQPHRLLRCGGIALAPTARPSACEDPQPFRRAGSESRQ
jgi:hypothetical protein